MDDLNGLDWSATSNIKPNTASSGTANYYPALLPTPSPANSGRNSPLSAQGSGALKSFAPPKSIATDSFSNLVSFGSSKTATLTLQQQQAKLQEEKRRKEAEQRKQYDAQFGNAQFWDGLGSTGKGVAGQSPFPSPFAATLSHPPTSPFAPVTSPPMIGNDVGNSEDDDLFAAFNKDTKVDNSSHYPPPSASPSRAHTPGPGTTSIPDLSNPQAWEQPASRLGDFGDDDDPFGLGQMKPRISAPAPISNTTDDDDDFLGDLGKPVEEVRRPTPAVPDLHSESSSDDEESNDPWDKAVAELMDMGFTAEQSRRALTESGSGLDIQAAVGWILNDAHAQAKAKTRPKEPSHRNGSASNGERRNVSTDGRKANPAWMREEGRSQSQQPRREDNRSSNNENDFSKTAAAVGSNIIKTANSFWKTSQKKIEKAVAEFQADADPSQPKWMREAAEREAISEQRARRAKAEAARNTPDVTDEALALESGSRPLPRKQKTSTSDSGASRDRSPVTAKFPPERPTSNPRWQQTRPQSRPTPPDPRVRVNKQTIEEQSAQAYVSPARRKKTTPQPQPIQEPEPDLLFAPLSQSKPASRPTSSSSKPKVAPSPKPPIPGTSRPKAPPRVIPAISPIALKSSTQHRLEGRAHFDRGDYSAAHASYTSSLSPLPQNHPIIIFLLAERAISSVKTGHSHEAISDADRAIEIIGSSRGQDEIIDLSTGAPDDRKPMKEYWGKALTSKAEALEALERWKDASDVWKLCIEGGVGGATAIQGRQRCDKALAPRPAPRPKPSAAVSLAPAPDSDAVLRLRAANQAAEKADDEKLALVDKVEDRVNRWREGKRDNLRALIGSLENVLWEGSGWKKVGLHELVVNSKVKINYMKAIGKCHPDKLPQDASQEVRMIAAMVFSTLNESWDSFKAQNGI
ncbi:hypothetical protein DSL72_005755 [Monilinia vaccinii-corymbosi]|uniref:UBA domain-containing protein n=1 Tax=Monilinia vaccinii-corymbosi TaxID=61207 RepID=A0A8A3PFZ0_9HELO|nr:hypothetical protein DSL72_005755 [Monilinia vaccinii-corymbosi]